MKAILLLVGTLVLASTAFASDHGPVFGYATPVNSQGEVSCDAGIFGRNGTRGTQFSTGTGCGYGITPHITINAFLPATFGGGSLPESRIYPGGEWTAGASSIPLQALASALNPLPRSGLWFLVLNRTPAFSLVSIESRASQDRSQLAMPHEASICGLEEATRPSHRRRMTDDPTPSRGVVSMVIGLPS
jgi:hypothetical protein